MGRRDNEYSEWTLEQVPADFLRKQNADRKIIQKQRTRDGRPPRIITLKTATDTTAASWNRFDGAIEECVVQLLLSGLPTGHPIYMTTEPPDDSTVPLGRFLANLAGTAFCLQVGPVWFYIPNQTGDATTFSAVVIYAGSELPAQLAALQGASPNGGTPVATLPVTWGTPAIKTINASDSAVLSANASRRGLSVFNASTAGQRIALTTENPATAVQGFMILDPGQGYVWNPDDGVTKQLIRGWASAAGGSLIVCEGT